MEISDRICHLGIDEGPVEPSIACPSEEVCPCLKRKEHTFQSMMDLALDGHVSEADLAQVTASLSLDSLVCTRDIVGIGKVAYVPEVPCR